MPIREARSSEASAITELVQRAYEHYVPRIGRRPMPMDEDYAELIASGEVFLLEEGGDVIVVTVIRVVENHLLVHNIAVEPSKQGHGHGRALLTFADGRAVDLGLPELRLYTHEAMTENIAMYQRLGWTEYDRRGDEGFARVFFRKPAG